MVCELGLVGLQVLVSTYKVLLQLVVEGLSGYLHTNTKHYLYINYLLLECCIQYAQMSLP